MQRRPRRAREPAKLGAAWLGRGPLRNACAHTLFNRQRWLCAEIVVTASAVVGLTDPKKVCGSNTYPLDIIDNHLHPELAEVYADYAYWSPHP